MDETTGDIFAVMAFPLAMFILWTLGKLIDWVFNK